MTPASGDFIHHWIDSWTPDWIGMGNNWSFGSINLLILLTAQSQMVPDWNDAEPWYKLMLKERWSKFDEGVWPEIERYLQENTLASHAPLPITRNSWIWCEAKHMNAMCTLQCRYASWYTSWHLRNLTRVECTLLLFLGLWMGMALTLGELCSPEHGHSSCKSRVNPRTALMRGLRTDQQEIPGHSQVNYVYLSQTTQLWIIQYARETAPAPCHFQSYCY